MPDQIYIGNFAKGLKLDRLPFNIDNDAFATLFNAYAWRGRARRKRGTLPLAQLQWQLESVTVPTSPWQEGPLVLVAGAGNLISGFGIASFATITPGSLSLVVSGSTYTEPTIPDGTLLKNGIADPGSTINYATGAVTIAGGGGANLTGFFDYYPGYPVMGLKDFTSSVSSSQYPLPLAFDTKYSYQLNQTTAIKTYYNVSYYKYTNNPVIWSGQDYQQFWSTNYPSTTSTQSGSFWATNNKPGFHFVNGTYVSGTGTSVITFTFTSNALPFQTLVAGTSTTGDQLWFNEWDAVGTTISTLSGYVSSVVNAATGTYQVTFSGNQTVSGTGIAQLLTNSIPGQDGIRWYDGDPTSQTGLPTSTSLGWVNFAPPLTGAIGGVSIDNTPIARYYLVGALQIVPFKDRLLFFSPYITSVNGVVIQLQDTVIWSWNGTPYYTNPVPLNQTSDTRAYYVDQTGFGGYLPAGISNPIITVSDNEDVLIVGFGGNGRKTRFVYTGNDLQPFLFFNINSELPSQSTFSAVPLDKGVIDIGQYGIAMTDQQSSQRVDLDIPDSVFQIQSLNNGAQRVNAVRDFFNEWIYFTYPVNNSPWKFPTQTFLFNYRDNTWSILYENYTTKGRYRPQNKRTWLTTGFDSWDSWREPWNSGSSSALFTQIICGNPQGYVLIEGQGTDEAPSGTIQAISNSGGLIQITSTNHCVSINSFAGNGDYLYFTGALGFTDINGLIGKVISTTDANTFVVDIPYPTSPGTYLGLGKYTRLSQPLIQTKQFPFYWDQGRQVRLCSQKYLMDATSSSQVTVNIYLSQDPTDAWNGNIMNPPPNSLVYSQIMYTCPESTNIGLTPANTNLQMPTAENQFQIWHRYNTSLIGDSVQIGITLSDEQMRNLQYATDEITLHGMHLTVDKAGHLA